MKRTILAAIFGLFCLQSFASDNLAKDVPKKQISQQQAETKPGAKAIEDFDYCSTQSDMYYDGTLVFTAVCTKCTASQAMADVMAKNCAFSAAKYASEHYYFYAETEVPSNP